eukprot:CFRG3271T1
MVNEISNETATRALNQPDNYSHLMTTYNEVVQKTHDSLICRRRASVGTIDWGKPNFDISPMPSRRRRLKHHGSIDTLLAGRVLNSKEEGPCNNFGIPSMIEDNKSVAFSGGTEAYHHTRNDNSLHREGIDHTSNEVRYNTNGKGGSNFDILLSGIPMKYDRAISSAKGDVQGTNLAIPTCTFSIGPTLCKLNGIMPLTGPINTELLLVGKGLSGDVTLKFGDIDVDFVAYGNETAVCHVPGTCVPGPVAVTLSK